MRGQLIGGRIGTFVGCCLAVSIIFGFNIKDAAAGILVGMACGGVCVLSGSFLGSFLDHRYFY